MYKPGFREPTTPEWSVEGPRGEGEACPAPSWHPDKASNNMQQRQWVPASPAQIADPNTKEKITVVVESFVRKQRINRNFCQINPSPGSAPGGPHPDQV